MIAYPQITHVLLFLCAMAYCKGSYGQSAKPASRFVGRMEESAYFDRLVQGQKYIWGTRKPDDIGPIKVDYDMTGMRKLPASPPAGVHPRILFTPDQLPEIRQRLKNTRVGRQANRLHKETVE